MSKKNKLKIVYYAVSSVQFLNPAKLSGSGGIFAGAGFLPDLEKVPDSGRSQNPVQPYFLCCCYLFWHNLSSWRTSLPVMDFAGCIQRWLREMWPELEQSRWMLMSLHDIHHSSVAVILWSDGVHWCRSDGDAQTTLPERYTGTRHLWANSYTRPVPRHCRHPTTSSGGKPLASLSESWNGLTFVNCVSACLQI